MTEPTCPDTHEHGATCYTSHACRCDKCRAANTARVKRQRYDRDPSILPPERHGRTAIYTNWGCRCEACTKAHKAYCAGWRANRKGPA